MLKALLADLKEPDYRNDPAFLQACEWSQSLNLDETLDAGQRVDVSRMRYEWALKDERIIDEKADAILKFDSVLALALITAARLLDPASNLLIWLLPSMVCFGWAIFCSLCARRPCTAPAPFDVRRAIESELRTAQFSTYIAVSFYCAEIGQRFISAFKSRWLERSITATVVAIVLLFASTAAYHTITSAWAEVRPSAEQARS